MCIQHVHVLSWDIGHGTGMFTFKVIYWPCNKIMMRLQRSLSFLWVLSYPSSSLLFFVLVIWESLTPDSNAFSIIYVGGGVMVLSSIGAQITRLHGGMLGQVFCPFVFCVVILFYVYSLLFVDTPYCLWKCYWLQRQWWELWGRWSFWYNKLVFVCIFVYS